MVERAAKESSGGPGYAFVRGLFRFLLALFYRRIEVHGIENLSARGGVVVAANHHNSIVDAMLLVGLLPRRLRTLANAPLFANPLVGPFLRLLGALPVHRRQEAGNDPARNAALFQATSECLRSGGGIAIFPEGRTQPEPVLLELRSGAARMLLAAAEGREDAPVSLVPVGLIFADPGIFREGEALMLIGAPVATADAVSLARTEPERAARLLTERLATAIRGLIVEAGDRQTLRALGLLEQLMRHEGGAVPEDPPGLVAWMQWAMDTYRRLAERSPDRVRELRRRLEEYAAQTARAGLDPARLADVVTPGWQAVRLALAGVALLVETPLALAGIALHVVPYRLTCFIVRKAGRTDEELATDKLIVGALLFPLTWGLELWAALRLGGSWAAGILLVALVPTAILALDWRERLGRLAREVRALFDGVFRPHVREQLLEKRRGLAAELRELAAQETAKVG